MVTLFYSCLKAMNYMVLCHMVFSKHLRTRTDLTRWLESESESKIRHK